MNTHPFFLGVPILMSQNIYELMSDEGKEHCRRVDKVRGMFLGSNLNLFFKFNILTFCSLLFFHNFYFFFFFFSFLNSSVPHTLLSLLFSNSLFSVLNLPLQFYSLLFLTYISFPLYAHICTSKCVVCVLIR
jgi:hypothetical protein